MRRNLFEPLSLNDLYEIHSTSLELLERVGIAVYYDEALKLLEEVGAEIDHSKHVARIPAYLVKDALGSVPNRFKLMGRDPKKRLNVDRDHTYFTIADCGKIIDIDGRIRDSTQKDAENLVILADYLKNVNFVSVPNAGDVPASIRDQYSYYIGFNNTTKPIAGHISNGDVARDVVEMASIVVGGADELRKNPPFCYDFCTTSPLQWDKKYVGAFKVLANSGIPVGICGTPMLGVTGPVTLAGTLVLANAEVLSGILLVQLFEKGAPCVYWAGGGAFDMRTLQVLQGAPESGLLGAATAQLARYYDLPSMSWIHTDAKISDAQAGYEKALGAFMQISAGNTLVWGIGMMDVACAGSYEEAVIDDEIVEMVFRSLRGIEVNEDSLALDVIERVGIGGNYIRERHTLRNFMKELSQVRVSDRRSREKWMNDGGKDTARRASEIAQKILKEHQPERLTMDVRHQLEKVLKRV